MLNPTSWFIGEETEARGRELTSPRSYSLRITAEMNFKFVQNRLLPLNWASSLNGNI